MPSLLSCCATKEVHNYSLASYPAVPAFCKRKKVGAAGYEANYSLLYCTCPMKCIRDTVMWHKSVLLCLQKLTSYCNSRESNIYTYAAPIDNSPLRGSFASSNCQSEGGYQVSPGPVYLSWAHTGREKEATEEMNQRLLTY